nr:BTB/POZ domain-containing protein At3g19850-like [Tanacetum cinerariifolium]
GAHDHLHYDSPEHSSRSSSRHEHKEVDDGVVKLNLQRMQWRVVELEKICREMKGQMSKMVKGDRIMSPHEYHEFSAAFGQWGFVTMVAYVGVILMMMIVCVMYCSRHEHKEVDDGVVKLNLQRMQWRVVELEKICREMKGQMSKMVKGDRIMSSHGRALPRLC